MPNNFEVEDVKPQMAISYDLPGPSEQPAGQTRILLAGMPMGLLLTITYPTAGTVVL